MKKKIMKVMIPGIILLIITVSYSLFKEDVYYNIKENDMLIALFVDGVKTSTFPTSGNYTSDIECTGANGFWLNNEHKFVVNNFIGQEVSCTINLTSGNSENNYIKDILQSISKSEAEIGNGENFNGIVDLTHDDNAGYRYMGLNPNNYAWFNNELWRIVGYVPTCVSDSACTSIPTDMRVKLVRDSSIGAYAFDAKSSSGTNVYTNSTLKELLNDAYLNSKLPSTNNYGYSGYQVTTDLRGIGLKNVQTMIDDVHFGIGSSSISYTKDTWNTEYNTSSSKVKVGLPSAADYGFASSGCYNSNTLLSDYANSACSGTNWINNLEWLITPYVDNYNVLFVSHKNCVSSDATSHKSALPTRPAIYLKPEVYVVNYNENDKTLGQSDNPFILAM